MNTKKYAVIDTETLGVVSPLVYDLGLLIIDKKGNHIERKCWIIKEVFQNLALFQTAYYAWKRPLYIERINSGEFEVVSWEQARREFNAILQKHDIEIITAYNANFDTRAMVYTNEKLGKSKKFLEKGKYTVWCIWTMFCTTIALQKTFHKMAEKHGWYTEAGNVKTSAEHAYKYIQVNPEYEENHIAIDDCEIEAEIFIKCLRQKKKMEKEPIAHPWRIPNKR